MLEKGVYAKAKFGKLWHRLWKMDCCGFRQVWRREAPTKGVQGACPRQAGDPCCRNGASEASPRAKGTGRKLVLRGCPALNQPLELPFVMTSSNASRRIPDPRITRTTVRGWDIVSRAIASVYVSSISEGNSSASQSLVSECVLTRESPLTIRPQLRSMTCE